MRARRLFLLATGGLAALAAGFWLLTAPVAMRAGDLPDHAPDLGNGERMFWAGGCAACHAAAGASGADRLVLGGGPALETPFGAFRAPNISPHRDAGIGAWSRLDFVNAMARGVAPDGRHYYPAFPYPYYQRMRLADLIDLKAFLDRLPPVATRGPGHDLRFPFTIRRGLGLWKRLYLDGARFQPDPARPALQEAGRYLVDGPGHCGACHTPRDWFGGPVAGRYLAGAAAFERADRPGGGHVPNITSHPDGIGGWSVEDIAYALETGMDPDFDSFGGSMVAVQENLARLPDADRRAIAAYLKAVPALPSQR